MKVLSSKELSSLAYKSVKQMVLEGLLKPGQKIVQDKLAEDLGISRTPLRIALQMLEAEYLVESIPRRGVFVRTFSDAEIVEVYDCRIALECIAVRRFTELASSAEAENLRSYFTPFLKNPREINDAEYQSKDVKFHNYIIDKSGNEFLAELFQQSNLLLFINQIGLVRPAYETLPEHMDIVDAVANGDADLAEKHIKNHLLKSKHLIIEKKILSES